jgi:integrase
MKHITSSHGIDRLVDGFQRHLREVKGLVPQTCAQYAAQARLFLTEQWQRAGHDLVLAHLDGPEILQHLTRQRTRYKPGRLQQYASLLRALLRFLVLTGHVPAVLVHAVPKIRTGLRVSPPDYLTEAQLQALLASLDPRTPDGARDQALLLVLAQMGLRAGEAADLTLDDLDWPQGTLRVTPTKGRRERQLPLSPSVRQALAHYLYGTRPATVHRRVFVGFPGGRPLSSQRVSVLVATALRRAHQVFPHLGAHLLRRTFATHLAQRGASVKAIADWLGHRRLDTAGRYIQVNLPLLQTVTQPWPEGVP